MTINLRRNRPQCIEEMANVVKDKVAANRVDRPLREENPGRPRPRLGRRGVKKNKEDQIRG
jgi:hypothetical protein